MYIKILLNYIMGYLNIMVEGYYIERFMNLCISQNIFLWNNKREKSSILYTNISIKDFKKIVKIAKQTKSKVKIKNKSGLPFIFNKYKKRKIFFIFLFLVVLGVMSLTNFVWNVEVEGNINIDTQELIKQLANDGLKTGVLKSKVNTKEIISKFRLERDDLAWVGIELKGTNAVVKVIEADKKPEIIKDDDYCNIVATKDAIIVKANAINGTPLVKEGDTIKQGTILVGGWLEGKYTGIRYVHANGEVTGKVWYSQTEKVETNKTEIKLTNNEENHYSIKINNFQINFGKTLSKFQNYDTIVSSKKMKLFSDFYMPIELIKTVNYEKIKEQVQYTQEEAKSIAIDKAREKLDIQVQQSKDNILNTYINFDQDKNEVTVIYEVLEEIGTKEKIIF